MRGSYPLILLCGIANVHRSGYYKWLDNQVAYCERKARDDLIKNHIMAIHQKEKAFGYPRVTTALKKEGLVVNHKRVYRLMKDMGIQSTIRKKRRYFGKKGSNIYPNLVNREFKNRKPNEVLVTDITYLPFNGRFYYLSVVQDLFNNEVISWKVSDRNDLDLVMDTIDEVIKKKNVHGTILHSDQGFQYTSKKYNQRLQEYGIIGSHSRKGNCLDNACVESFFSHFKTEMLYPSNCKTEQELLQVIEDAVYYYNFKRFQKRLNQCAPIEYRVTLAA